MAIVASQMYMLQLLQKYNALSGRARTESGNLKCFSAREQGMREDADEWLKLKTRKCRVLIELNQDRETHYLHDNLHDQQ
jgi:hypothetical protein